MAKTKRKQPTPAIRPVSKGTRPAARGTSKPQRDRRLLYVVAALVAAVVLAVVVAQSNSTDDTEDAGDTGRPAAGGELLRTEAPWEPQVDGLPDRVEAAGFPPVGDESYHVHALLSVYVDGEQVPVPANIGIDPRSGYHSPLHTHTPDGVIHFEADDPSPFTLQQVFSMWGVDFSAMRLGAYVPAGDKTVHVYVNGEPVDAPVDYELQEGDNVVVAYGVAGSFPTEPPADALAGA